MSPHSTSLHSTNGGAIVDTLGANDEPLVHTESCLAAIAQYGISAVLAVASFAVGCWLLKVPAWLWR